MADFNPAVQITLLHEGGFFHNQVTGEIVNRGITLSFVRDSGYAPDADEAFIRDLSPDQTNAIYLKYFWQRYNLGAIGDQGLANKAFDLTVNMGAGGSDAPGALTLLQNAVNDCGGTCTVDGHIGPLSIAAINSLDPVRLLAAYKQRAAHRYQQIADGDPHVSGDLSGWLARLDT